MTDQELQVREVKKNYLKRYKRNLALIDRLNEKVKVLDARIYSIKSPSFSDMPRGGTPVTKEDLVNEKEEIKDRIARLEDKGKKLKAEILDKIDELEDYRYAEVLEAFFIEGKDFGDIAEDNGYTVRHVIRLYTEAINTMSL